MLLGGQRTGKTFSCADTRYLPAEVCRVAKGEQRRKRETEDKVERQGGEAAG